MHASRRMAAQQGQPGRSTAAETSQDNPRTQLDHCYDTPKGNGSVNFQLIVSVPTCISFFYNYALIFRDVLNMGFLNEIEFSQRLIFKLMKFETLLIIFLAVQQQQSLLSHDLF